MELFQAPFSPFTILLDAICMVAACLLLISCVKTHGMRATVHFVRLATAVMVCFTAIQFRWEEFFDVMMGRTVLNEFVDVKNSLLLTFLFYTISIVVLFVYQEWQRRAAISSATSATVSPPPSQV